MAAEMTLEAFETRLTNFKLVDLRKKMAIAKNISKQCNAKLDNNSNDSTLSVSHELTGIPTETLLQIQRIEHRAIKFEEWLKEQKQMVKRYSYEYISIRELLLKHYTQLLEVPTGIKEKNEYEGYKTFFTVVQLPGTQASILVEKPETVRERHRFLYKKIMYREQKKNLFYIGKVNLHLSHGIFSCQEDNVEGKNRFTIAASPKFGYLGHIYSCGYTDEGQMKNWLEEKIIPQLPNESVIIFQENVLNDVEDPKVNELSKENIINWLNTHEINHDPKAHRAELYKLVMAFKKSQQEQLSVAEFCFRSRGHITMRKKKCNLNINYFDPFWDLFSRRLTISAPTNKTLMKSNANSINLAVVEAMENLSLAYWNNLENKLIEKERDMFREDLEMEYVVDKLMTMVRNEGLPKEWETRLDHHKQTVDKEYIIISDSLLNMQKTKCSKSINIFKQ